MNAAFQFPPLMIKAKQEDLRGGMRFARVNRPLSGKDLAEFHVPNNIRKRDAIFALGIPTFVIYQKVCRTTEPLPIEKELLIRLYDQYPRHVAWRTIQPRQLFDMLYGDLMAKFVGTEHETPARLALYTRIMACFGRSPSTAYRWFEGPDLGEETGGRAKVEILMLMNLLSTLENPREVFEALARQTLAYRGLDLDMAYPLPDPANPPPVRKPGRKPSPTSKKALKLAAAAKAASGVGDGQVSKARPTTKTAGKVAGKTAKAPAKSPVKTKAKGDATQEIAKQMKKAARKVASEAALFAQSTQNGGTSSRVKKAAAPSARAKEKAGAV